MSAIVITAPITYFTLLKVEEVSNVANLVGHDSRHKDDGALRDDYIRETRDGREESDIGHTW